MGEVTDMMKDLAMTEKGIAKAHHYYSEHSEETF